MFGRDRRRFEVASYCENVSRSFLRVLVASRSSADVGCLCGSLGRFGLAIIGPEGGRQEGGKLETDKQFLEPRHHVLDALLELD